MFSEALPSSRQVNKAKLIPTDRNNATDEKLLSVVPPRRDFYLLAVFSFVGPINSA
jgi:hypothetical protein